MSVTKNALTESYTPFDTVTYVVSIRNSGTVPFTGLTVTDDLGGYEFNGNTVYPLQYTAGSASVFVNGELTLTPVVNAGPPLTVSNITVPAGGNVIIVYETEVTEFASPEVNGQITNEVTVSGGGLTAPITADKTITPAAGPDLVISKSLSPTVVSDNSTLTYTFVIQNVGNEAADATDNIVVTDTFNPILTNITVTLNGTVLTAGTDYTYNETTGEFATVQSRITVPAASYTQDPDTGIWITEPGSSVLVVTGTI